MLSIEIAIDFHVPSVSIDIGDAVGEVGLCPRVYDMLGHVERVIFHGRYNRVEPC